MLNDSELLKLLTPTLNKDAVSSARNLDELYTVFNNAISDERDVSHLEFLILKSAIDDLREEIKIMKENPDPMEL